jgi:hypothetical protein
VSEPLTASELEALSWDATEAVQHKAYAEIKSLRAERDALLEERWRLVSIESELVAALKAELAAAKAERDGWAANAGEVAGHCSEYLLKMAAMQNELAAARAEIEPCKSCGGFVIRSPICGCSTNLTRTDPC